MYVYVCTYIRIYTCIFTWSFVYLVINFRESESKYQNTIIYRLVKKSKQHWKIAEKFSLPIRAQEFFMSF